MPLIAHNTLPAYDRLKQEGSNVLPYGQAITQDIRELHIGLLNLMPDASLRATERQFLRLIGESNQIAQFYVHVFTLPEIPRSEETQAYIDEHYDRFEDIQKQGLDALIITGANVKDPELENAEFWEPLQRVMDWSWKNVTSTITACLASHAVMQFRYGQKRSPQAQKRWGIYKSVVEDRTHPIVQNMNTAFDVPHSRWNAINRSQFEEAGMRILVGSCEGESCDVHLATSPDGFRLICFQGHQEYDTLSLLKEYKREIQLYLSDDRDDYPPFPLDYLPERARALLDTYRDDVIQDSSLPFPEQEIAQLIDNTWRDSGKAIIGNWIGKVYQLTHIDRTKPFMDGVDPDDPLGLNG